MSDDKYMPDKAYLIKLFETLTESHERDRANATSYIKQSLLDELRHMQNLRELRCISIKEYEYVIDHLIERIDK